MTDSLLQLFERDLNQLIKELELYSNESKVWLIAAEINNSAGNLALHLIGNINHFIGSVLGKTDYVRQRELEFSQKDIPSNQLVDEIRDTISMLKTVLPKISAEELQSNFPIEVFGRPMTTEYFLMHLSTHLAYHLGQVNYHRRLIK